MQGSLEAKLSALAAARADLESDLSEALRQSPATRLKRQLQAFLQVRQAADGPPAVPHGEGLTLPSVLLLLQVYLCGIDFENVHLFENLPAFHMATVVGEEDRAGPPRTARQAFMPRLAGFHTC